MVQIQQTKTLTLSEFVKLPETEPASEYINGKIIQKPIAQGKHSRIQSELVPAINVGVKIQKIALAFPELRCTFVGGRSIVPDITVFTWERIPVDENGDVANLFETYPDWTIEILSPSQSLTKVTGNILHCLKNGTKMGLPIDPMVGSILICPPGKQPEILAKPEGVLPVPNWAGELRLTVGDLFGWLKL
ncbi:Uma2 family endonuclease [Microcoleus sp. F10-C6]|uniref:Uma2 family endonuclease n=1 Tax=unclassified Microcoleus TaxID=2642155 RepID=UPI002FD589B2